METVFSGLTSTAQPTDTVHEHKVGVPMQFKEI